MGAHARSAPAVTVLVFSYGEIDVRVHWEKWFEPSKECLDGGDQGGCPLGARVTILAQQYVVRIARAAI